MDVASRASLTAPTLLREDASQGRHSGALQGRPFDFHGTGPGGPRSVAAGRVAEVELAQVADAPFGIVHRAVAAA